MSLADIAALRGIPISEIISRCGLELKRGKACCPFHKEKTPSFSVHPAKNIWHCFGCGAGGDGLEFVRRYYGMDFLSAARWMNDTFGLGLSFAKPESSPSAPSREIVQREIDRATEGIIEHLCHREAIRLRAEYNRLRIAKNGFRPSADMQFSDFPRSYIEALQRLPLIEARLDILDFGGINEKIQAIK